MSSSPLRNLIHWFLRSMGPQSFLLPGSSKWSPWDSHEPCLPGASLCLLKATCCMSPVFPANYLCSMWRESRDPFMSQHDFSKLLLRAQFLESRLCPPPTAYLTLWDSAIPQSMHHRKTEYYQGLQNSLGKAFLSVLFLKLKKKKLQLTSVCDWLLSLLHKILEGKWGLPQRG